MPLYEITYTDRMYAKNFEEAHKTFKRVISENPEVTTKYGKTVVRIDRKFEDI